MKNSIKLKHYCQKGTKRGDQPALFFEVGFEVQDVRSEYRDSYQTCFQAEWLEESDLFWTPDMVNQISVDLIEEIQPFAFRKVGPGNQLTKCPGRLFLLGIPMMDLSVFKE